MSDRYIDFREFAIFMVALVFVCVIGASIDRYFEHAERMAKCEATP